MADPKQTGKTAPSDPNEVGIDTRTLSAPTTIRVHGRLATAQKTASLDKASLVRLAVRLFIRNYYKGGGVWDFPKELDLDMIVASDPARCDYNLPD